MIRLPKQNIELQDFPDPAPARCDFERTDEQLLAELEASLMKDRRVGRSWGLSESLIRRQEEWRRWKYRELISSNSVPVLDRRE